LHGGSISAESAGENRGATFVVQLPAVALGLDSSETRRRALSETIPRTCPRPPDLTGLVVLVVEDEPDTRELIEHTLRLAGANVMAVESAGQALSALRLPPHVLVSDIGLPEEDGYSLIERVRRLPTSEGGGVPALAVSAYVREEDRMRALMAGFQGHVAKPFEPAELVAAIGSLTGRGPAAAEAGPGDGAEAAETAGQGDSLPARVLIVEDDKDSREGRGGILLAWGHGADVAG